MRCAAVIALILLATTPPAAGQALGSLEGVVADSSGARLPGVTVEITPKVGDRVVATTTTDRQGWYRVAALQPGPYVIRFTLAGFTRQQLPVVVTSSQPTVFGATLEVDRLTESVEVIASDVSPSLAALEAVKFGNQVQVVSAEAIERSGSTNFAEAMQFLAKGVNIGYSPDEGEYTIRLDGGGDRDTLVVLDGVPLFDRGPALEDIWGATTIDPHMIERVEVFRGGNSLFYGSNGGIGVVSVVTKRPDGTRKGDFGVNFGSFKTRELWGNYSFPLDADGRHSVMFYGSMQVTDGPRIFDPNLFVDNVALAGGIQGYPLNRNNIGGKYLFKIGADTAFRLNAQFTEVYFQDAFPGTEVLSPNTTRFPIIDASLEKRWGKSLTEVSLYYSNPTLYNTELFPEICRIASGCVDPNNPSQVVPRGAWTGAVEPFANKGFGSSNQFSGGFKEYGATLRSTIDLGKYLALAAGVQTVRYQDDSDPVFPVGDEQTTVTGLFVDVRPRLPFSPKTSIAFAARRDFANTFADRTVWKFGARQPVGDSFYLRANGGTSYSTPRNTELHNQSATLVGNPDLTTEETETYNTGIGINRTFDGGGLVAEVGGFRTDINNRIQTTSGLTPNTYFNNAAVTEIRGLTADLDLTLNGQWTFNVGYTKQEAVPASGPQKGVQINETSEWFAQGAVGWTSKNERLNLQLLSRYQGPEYSTGGPAVGGVPRYRHNFGDYAVVNATVNYYVGDSRQHRVQLRVVNMFDEKYAERWGFANQFYGSAFNRGEFTNTDDRYFFGYPFEGKPRSVFLSISTRF